MSTWTIRRVGDMARLINGHPFDSDDFTPTGEVPLVRIRDIAAADFETYVPQHTVPQDKVLKDGDVVIGMDGDFNVIRWRRGTAALNQRVCALRDTGVSDLRFLAYALPDHLKVINDLTYSTTVKHLSSGQVTGLRITAPDRDDQGRIADYLDRETATIDALIEKQQRLRSVLKERRQEVVRAHLADVGPQVQLRHLVVRERPMTYGILQAGEHDDGGVPYIGPADISRVGGTPALQDLRRTTVEIAAQYQRSTLRPGDLVASIGPAYGHVMEVSEELDGANLTQDTVRLALDPDRADRRYLMWVLQGAASRDFWNFEITGATFRRLNLGTLARTPVPLPSLNEQREIADHLDRETAKIDALIAKAERFIELARERRAALITAAVTGQIEIPTED